MLVDVGISCREVERRMKRLGLEISKVKAIFVSHEHGDHIRGVPVLSRKHNIPVYITEPTLQYCPGIHATLVRHFAAHEPVQVDSLSVVGFPKLHDAVDAHSFVVKNEKVTVGVFTDIGTPCEQVKTYFKRCHAAFLETNYDEEMLDTGRYPLMLKRRVKGDRGHLSNVQAAELFLMEGSTFLSHLFLSHLSHNNNSPRIVNDLFRKCAGDTRIIIASREKETAVYPIQGTHLVDLRKRRPIRSYVPAVKQLTLW